MFQARELRNFETKSAVISELQETLVDRFKLHNKPNSNGTMYDELVSFRGNFWSAKQIHFEDRNDV